MPHGTPFNRNWVVILNDGSPVLDWGDGLFQDIMTGDFMQLNESTISRAIMDNELDRLHLAGRIFGYDSTLVYLGPLPERNRRTLD